MKQRRWPILAVPLLLWLLSQVFLRQPGLFYAVLALGTLIIVLGLRLIVRPVSQDWTLFLIAPVLLVLSFSGLAAILLGAFLIQAIFVLEFFFVFSYLRDVYYHFYYHILLLIFLYYL